MTERPGSATASLPRRLVAAFLLVSFLLAGVGSFYASSHPDGLEAVAGKTRFIDTARDSAASDSPLADYQTDGIANEQASGGLAGVIGTLVVLSVSGGIFYVLRRRPSREPAENA